MKKFALFCAIAVALSTFSIGCTSSGSGSSSSSWCRMGSPWSRTNKESQTVYTTSAIGACNEVSACNPCEPACNPCEPICDPCAMSCTGVVSSGIYPGPSSN